ncbi:hypothetical protein CGC20_17130 [Leishmania donovani]|uniref:Uncharacterized protein n=1 Tax=Leishmania donovani TaxID=5661 RepID=A0A504XRA9_LEIDO|nr:hypothetical protein CGC20_17130 [Leishmania donovani]
MTSPPSARPCNFEDIDICLFKLLYSPPLSLAALVRAGLFTEDDDLRSSKRSVTMPLLLVASPPASGAAGGAALVSPAAVISALARCNGASWNKENDGARVAQPQRPPARPLSANASPALVTPSPAPAAFPNVAASPITTAATTAVPCMSSEALRRRRCRICHRLLVVALCRPS